MKLLFTYLIVLLITYCSYQSLADESIVDNKSLNKDNKVDKRKIGKTFNVDELEKNWKEGDSKNELEEEHEIIQRIVKEKQATRVMPNWDDPIAVKKWLKKDGGLGVSAGGGSSPMMFVELMKTQPNGEAWTEQSIAHTTQLWQSLLKTGIHTGEFCHLIFTHIMIKIL
jgi:hypothetical protein